MEERDQTETLPRGLVEDARDTGEMEICFHVNIYILYVQ